PGEDLFFLQEPDQLLGRLALLANDLGVPGADQCALRAGIVVYEGRVLLGKAENEIALQTAADEVPAATTAALIGDDVDVALDIGKQRAWAEHERRPRVDLAPHRAGHDPADSDGDSECDHVQEHGAAVSGGVDAVKRRRHGD